MPKDKGFKDETTNTIFIYPEGRAGELYSKIAINYLELSQKEGCKVISVWKQWPPYEISPEMKEYQAVDQIKTAIDLADELNGEQYDIKNPDKKLSFVRSRIARKIDAEVGTKTRNRKKVVEGIKKLSNLLFSKMYNSRDE